MAASGVPSALYGCSVTAPSVAALRSLQTAAFHAVWRSGSRSAQELVFGLFVPWRANPEAVCIVQPIQFLRDAIRRGLVDVESLPWLFSMAPTTGPIHAFLTACQRAGLEVSHDATSLLTNGTLLAWTSDPWFLVRQALLGALMRKAYSAVSSLSLIPI